MAQHCSRCAGTGRLAEAGGSASSCKLGSSGGGSSGGSEARTPGLCEKVWGPVSRSQAAGDAHTHWGWCSRGYAHMCGTPPDHSYATLNTHSQTVLSPPFFPPLPSTVCRYDDGTSAIFSTCANPDADPLGHWCQVDPTKCDNFATILKNGDQVGRRGTSIAGRSV